MRNHDLVFLKHFSMVIGALAVLTLGLMGFAAWLHSLSPTNPEPVAQAKLESRIAPVGAVYAGDTGAAAMNAAAEAARAAMAAQVAYGGTLDGSVIYDNLCGSCHKSGAGGAPLMTQAAWQPRVAQGMETLVQHAIEGYKGDAGIMPPKGGNPSLTDEQVRASVTWMVNNLK